MGAFRTACRERQKEKSVKAQEEVQTLQRRTAELEHRARTAEERCALLEQARATDGYSRWKSREVTTVLILLIWFLYLVSSIWLGAGATTHGSGAKAGGHGQHGAGARLNPDNSVDCIFCYGCMINVDFVFLH